MEKGKELSDLYEASVEFGVDSYVLRGWSVVQDDRWESQQGADVMCLLGSLHPGVFPSPAGRGGIKVMYRHLSGHRRAL